MSVVQRQRCRWAVAIAVVSLVVGTGGGAPRADDEGSGDKKRRDHEIARKALVSGEIRPLEAVIAEVRSSVPGEIVGIELEKHQGRWTYKIKVITPSGAMQRVLVDARSNGEAPGPTPGVPHALPPGPAKGQ